jgi:hypothetical protein
MAEGERVQYTVMFYVTLIRFRSQPFDNTYGREEQNSTDIRAAFHNQVFKEVKELGVHELAHDGVRGLEKLAKGACCLQRKRPLSA